MSYYEDNRKRIKEALLNEKDWRPSIGFLYFGEMIDSYSKQEVMWVLCDILRTENPEILKKYNILKKSVEIAKDFVNNDQDDETYKTYDRQVREGEDPRAIVTVKGTLPHLLQTVISKLDTSYYLDLINITESLVKDANMYVRRQSVFALDSFAINIYAEKFPDGTPFSFDRERVKKIAFNALKDKDTQNNPRVIEYMAQVFNRFRRESSIDAKVFLDHLVYKNGDTNKKEFQPDYALREVAPLLIYYAEFRNQLNNDFDNTYFTNLLKDVLSRSDSNSKSNIIWHIWKTTEDNPQTLVKFKKYIPLVFEGEFQKGMVNQLSLLIEKIFAIDPDYSLEIFSDLIKYIKEKKKEPNDVIWLLFTNELFAGIAKNKPDQYLIYLSKIFDLWQYHPRSIFIGDFQAVFTAYVFAPAEKHESLKRGSQEIYKEMQKMNLGLNDLIWS